MKTRIVLKGKAIDPIVEVDGQVIPCKSEKNGSRTYDILTSNGIGRIKIYSLKHELSEKYWWFFAFLFYLISVCGIFNPTYSKKYYTLHYEGFLKNYTEALELQLNPPKKDAKAISCISGVFDDNSSNVYGLDKVAKRRRKICLLLKLLSWVAIAAVVIVVLMNQQ